MPHLRIRSAICVACLVALEQVSAQTALRSGARQEDAHATAASKQPAASEQASVQQENQAETCIEAHELGQLLRLDGKLTEARKALKACSQEDCPAVLQRDCVQWLDEVSTQIPTVVFEAITESGAAQKVRISHAKRVVTEELDGRPVELNPGYYEFRFEVDNRAPKTLAVLLKQGEKNRMLSADFRDPLSPASTLETAALPPAGRAPPSLASSDHLESAQVRPIPKAVYVFGGLAIASAVTAVVLGLNTRSKEASAYAECAPRCSAQRIEGIQLSARLTDAALGTAALSTALAIALYAVRPDAPDTTIQQQPAGLLPSDPWQVAGARVAYEGSF